MQLRPQALQVLLIADPAAKAEAARALLQAARAGELSIDPDAALGTDEDALPGRPPRPRLVAADQVPRRSPFTLAGRAALLHAIAHIEFNAIKLVYNEGHDDCTEARGMFDVVLRHVLKLREGGPSLRAASWRPLRQT